jgi:hypothetical protein
MASGLAPILKGKYMPCIAKLCVEVSSFAGFGHLTPRAQLAIIH